ncbi:CDP-diacylglycerol--glycerol-3-phosphate 3-phosphatidyltransferase [Galactobacter valiniphilus]|uniref:CDP-diacylglycerol--glycerol-3-phosphate 3-phosphatidyltransferase n=1 Tax=Galactobacter valiniphilus TaxID=2676122 RepID=UPI003734F71B
MTEQAPAPAWNIANVLTGVRIVLIPVFVAFMLMDAQSYGLWRWLAVLVFAVAVYTDKLDGDIARARGLVTSFGKIADPIADKLLMGAALVLLSALGELTWWITVIILVREIGITVMRFWVIRWGVIAASAGGKIKTVTQALGTFILLLPWTPQHLWLAWIGWVIIGIAAAITLYSAIDYVRQAAALYRGHQAKLAGGAGSTGAARPAEEAGDAGHDGGRA